MDVNEPLRIVFVLKYEQFTNLSPESIEKSVSPTIDILQTAQTFGLLNTIRDMIRTNVIISKSKWSEEVWARAWTLDDQVTRANNLINP